MHFQRLAHWTSDRHLTVSISGRSALTQFIHTHTCLCSPYSINWYRSRRWWRSKAGKVTAGLVECNDSLLPGLWLTSPAGCLPRKPEMSTRTMGVPLPWPVMLVGSPWTTLASYAPVRWAGRAWVSETDLPLGALETAGTPRWRTAYPTEHEAWCNVSDFCLLHDLLDQAPAQRTPGNGCQSISQPIYSNSRLTVHDQQ